MVDLVLDPSIRNWVLVPIFVVMFLLGVFRHYISEVMKKEKAPEVQQVMDGQAMTRSSLLRLHCDYIPASSFAMRKQFFVRKEGGWFASQERSGPANPMSDPNMMMDMMKGNLSFVIPQALIMGWINYFFSGFVTTKVPFPLTIRFKPMLQRGVELSALDASWVSSLSWYFLNMFGMKGVHSLILGENNSADQSKMMQQQMTGGLAGGAPNPMADMRAAFKAEAENLELTAHTWALDGVEERLLKSKQA